MGILFSHNNYHYLYNEFEKLNLNNNFYILAISNLDTNTNNNKLSEKTINILKTDAINKIKELNNNFIKYWEKYDVNYFKLNNIEVLINLIKIKKNMIHQNISKFSEIYDNVVKVLMLEHEIDHTIYKT
jgi:hypothetical protein